MLFRLFHQSRVLASSTWLAGVWLLASACGPGVATPMPEPPAAVFDLDGLKPTDEPLVEPALHNPDASYAVGARGSVPAGATVRITNLDTTSEVSATTADAMGAFTAVVFARDGEELRFEWLKGSQRSLPADAITVKPDPTAKRLVVTPSPRFDCLSVTPNLSLDFMGTTSATLTIDNQCAEEITLANPRARLTLADFQLEDELPQAIVAGETVELAVGFTRTGSGLREDILMIDVTRADATIRYPITLRAE